MPASPVLRTVAFAACSLVVAQVLSEELPLTHFTTEHQRVPLPSSSVQTIYQDRTGFIWLGFFSSGLARYDGQELELFGMADGLLDSTVREVLQDGSGYIWVGSETGVVVSDRPVTAATSTRRPRFRSRVGEVELARTRIRHTWMAPAADGGVWVATSGQGLRHYRMSPDGRVHESAIPLGTGADSGTSGGASLALRSDGTVWVALESGPVGFIEPDADTITYLAAQSVPCTQVTALHEAPDGALWAGCRTGMLIRLVESGPPRFTAIAGALTEQVNSILATPAGDVWVCSLGSGVLLLPGGRAEAARRFDRRHGFLSETVWHLLRDHEGSLWFATNSGCSRLRPNYAAFEHFTGRSRAGVAPSLPDPSVFAVLPPAQDDPDGVIWAGTGGGLAALAADGRRAVVGVADGLPSGSIYTLTRDSSGRIWIGTLEGLGVLTPGPPLPGPLGRTQQRRLLILGRPYRLGTYPTGTLYGSRVLPVAARADRSRLEPAVWLSGTAGVTVWGGGSWFVLHTAAGVPASGAVSTSLDPDGRLWVVSKDSGVLRSPGPVTLEMLRRGVGDADSDRTVAVPLLEPWWDRNRGAPTNAVHNLLWAGDRMWIGSAAGLFAVAGDPAGITTRLDRETGLGGNHVMGMALDPSSPGSLWVTQNSGLAEVDITAGRVLRTVSKADGLIDNEAWGADSSLAVAEDGTVYLGTPKGLTRYRPALDHGRGGSPRLVLRTATIEDEPSAANEVNLQWSALTFIDESGVRYRTRLRGFSDRWSPPTADTRLRYTNLPALFVPTGYTFEVAATTGSDSWSEPLSFAFTVRPVWWQSWWAAAAAVLVLALGVQISNRWRTARLRQRTRKLESVVAARTTELRTYAAELETLDRIVATVNREVVFDKVATTLLDQGLVLLRRARTGVLLLTDEDGERFAVAASTGWPPGLVEDLSFPRHEALARFADPEDRIGEGISVVRGLEHRPGADRVRHLPPGRTLLAVDLQLEGRVVAFLLFDLGMPFERLRDAEIRALERYRQHAIIALDKAHAVRELERAGRAAEQASRAKSAFLAAMSHELRTPLNAIIGFSEILLRKLDGADDPRVPRFLTNILSSGQHLLALINDILDLSKIESGRMVLEIEQVSVGSLVDDVCRIAHGMAATRGIELVQKVEAGLPDFRLDAGKVRQVLFNLVSNAVKFSPEGSRVVVLARTAVSDTGSLGRRTLELAVEDRGIGIAAEDQERIFEEFRQLDSGSGRRFGGSGLGLALVRRYVALMAGRVVVTSAPGAGSTFTVLLPADPPEAAPDAPTAAWPAARLEQGDQEDSPQRHRGTEPPPTRD